MKQKYQNDLGFIVIYALLLLLPLLLIAQDSNLQNSYNEYESILEIERATLEELLIANPNHNFSNKWNSVLTEKNCKVCMLEEVTCNKDGFVVVMHLGDKNLEVLPASIHNLSNLKALHLEENKLVSLPSTLGNMTQLNHLSVFDNQIISLPGQLRKLATVSVERGLEGNPIEGQMTWVEFCKRE